MKLSLPSAIEIQPRTGQQSQFDPDPLAPEPPCTGCRYAVTCRTRQLACDAFMQYLVSGQWKALPARHGPNRRPTVRLFRH